MYEKAVYFGLTVLGILVLALAVAVWSLHLLLAGALLVLVGEAQSWRVERKEPDE